MKSKPDRLSRRDPDPTPDGDACQECHREQGHALDCSRHRWPTADPPSDAAPSEPSSRYLPGMQRAANLLRRDAGELYAVGDDKAAKWIRRAALRVEEGIRLMREHENREGKP